MVMGSINLADFRFLETAKPFISTRPLAYRSTFMVDAARDAGVKFDEKALSRSRRRASPRPRQLEGREPEVGQPGLSRIAEDRLLGYKQLTAPGARCWPL
jgi:hypothetical protein